MKTDAIYIILFILIVVLSALIYVWYTGNEYMISSLGPGIAISSSGDKNIKSVIYGEKRPKTKKQKVKFSETVLERKIDEIGNISDRPIELHVSAR